MYDLDSDDLTYEIFSYYAFINKKYNSIVGSIKKSVYIDVLLNLINSRTNFLNINMKKQALYELFSILDIERKYKNIKIYLENEEIKIMELIGALIILGRGNSEEKMRTLFYFLKSNSEYTFCKENIVLILTGVLKLFLKKDNILKIDAGILSEIVVEKLFIKLNTILEGELTFKDLYGLIANINTSDKILDKSNSENYSDLSGSFTNKSSNERIMPNNFENLTPNFQIPLLNLHEVIDSFTNKLTIIKKVNVLEALNIFKKNSLLGQINQMIFVDSINEMIDLNQENDHNFEDRAELITSLVNLCEINSNTMELFDVSDILCRILFIFDGTKEEKINSIFKIFDDSDNNSKILLSYEEILFYTKNFLYIILIKIFNLDKNYSHQIENLGHILIDDLYNYFQYDKSKNLNVKNMNEYFEFI